MMANRLDDDNDMGGSFSWLMNIEPKKMIRRKCCWIKDQA